MPFNFGNKKKSNKQSNSKSNLSPFEKPVKKDDDGKPIVEPAAKPTPELVVATPEEQQASMRKYFKEQGLFDGIDIPAMMKAMRDDDAEAFGDIYAKGLENTAQVALLAANKVTTAQVARMQEDTTSAADTKTRRSLAIEQMHVDLPFTKSANVAPHAQVVLEGFMNNHGMAQKDAIEATADYFKETVESAGPELGLHVETQEQARKNKQGFAGTQNDNNGGAGSGDEPIDWLDTFSSGRVTEEDKLNQQAESDAAAAAAADT